MTRLRAFIERADPQYDHWLAVLQARTSRDRGMAVVLHLLPGAAALLAIKWLAPLVHAATGAPYHWLQFTVLVAMALGWELTMPFVWLRRDGLTFHESLDALGLRTFDGKGVFVVVPLLILALSVIGGPYLVWGYEPVRQWLDTWSILHMPPWHILYYGYFNFPPLAVLVVVIANFLGEEVYFRGYLLKRLGFLGPFAWLASNGLFLAYHLWQAPVNWAYLPVFFLVPFGPAMAWRRSIWPAVAAHVALNLGAAEWLLSIPAL